MAARALAVAAQVLVLVAAAEAIVAPAQGFAPLRLRGGGVNTQRTYAMIKPDAVKAGKVDEMQALLKSAGFKIIKQKKVKLSQEQAKEFYSEHKARPFFGGLVEFMTSGDAVLMILQKDNAIKAWREFMGPTNSLTAKKDAPNSLRAKFGTDGSKNACHGSDSPKSARREIRLMFGLVEWIQVAIWPLRMLWF